MNSEVKPGYKQTEIGLIPSDWAVKSLGQVVQLQRGYDLPHRVRKSGIVPIVSSSGICGYHDQTQANGPGVVTGRYGTIGTVYFVQEDFWPLNTTLFVKDFKGSDPLFISYLLRTIDFESHSGKSGVPGVNRNDLHELLVACPTVEEQQAIALALSDIDTLISSLDQLIAKKRDIQQATMQQLLTGQRRLPGFSGEWEMKRLGDLAEMGSGGTPLSSVTAYYDGDIPWVSISDMTKGGKIIESTERNLTTLGFANSAAQIFPVGTVLYAMYASLGECSIAGKALCTSQAILGIRAKNNLHAEFLYYYLVFIKENVKTLGQQGTQSNLNKGMVQDFLLSLPSLPEQTAIATILSDMDADLATLEARREKARQLKQGMMQELLSGRIRLV